MTGRTLSRRGFLASSTAAALSGVPSPEASATQAEFQPTWESLDTHRCPEWFRDGKLGMYFHWGLSSVPGWAPRAGGTPYAEWYWYSMCDEKNPTWRYHRDTYGKSFSYDDFIPRFRASKYRPEDWISVAKRAGARYVFMNAKHHDGFCMWPSKVTNRNSFRMGPKRDLLGPFVAAARRENLRVGFYYSFYEWFNPLYTGKPAPYTGYIPRNSYVEDYMAPQVRELIDLYHPDFLYFDGEWDRPPEYWKSRELAAYFYNRAAKEGRDALLNDRFGKDVRGRHGDVFNVEYDYDTGSEGLLTHPWSYWRGIAKTFGYNRDADPEDCLSEGDLIRMFVDGTSRNGNFDINVGPAADGTITNYERRPLEALGDWLVLNGEAVYGSRPWRIQSEEDIRFTMNKDYVYAIFLKWPGERLRIKSLRAAEGTEVTMLGIPGSLEWRREDEGISVEFPLSRSRPTECAHAWVMKVRSA
jgi:alpha-L-fucosidase